MSAFGTIILPTQIEAAVTDVFQTWMDTYLRELERVTGRTGGALPPIRSWAAASATDQKLPEQQLPAVQVTWADMQLTRHADGLSSLIPFTVEVLVQSTDFNSVRSLASLYGFALVLIAGQKMRRNELVASITTPQLSVPVVSGAERRWRAIATVDFEIETDLVASTLVDGPDVVAPDPTPVPPDAVTVNEGGVVLIADLLS